VNQNVLAPIFLNLYKYTGKIELIPIIRRLVKIQLKAEQISKIGRKVKSCQPCNFLVFGMGNDSRFWQMTNKEGNTCFVEDNEKWYNRVLRKTPVLNACLVTYDTTMAQWKNFIDTEDALQLDLPDAIKTCKWDLIFVDAPRGKSDHNPGRMKSIFMASQLIKSGGTVFVHDCDREVERAYCRKYLKEENLISRVGSLDEYLLP